MAFVTLKYGAGEEMLLNPNCMASVLLNHIKKNADVIKSVGAIHEPIDIATESGEVVDLMGKAREYAKKYVDPRATYVLVKIVGADESGEAEAQYIPLCDQLGERVKFMLASSRQKKRGGHGAPSIASDRTGTDRDVPDNLSPNRAAAGRNRAKSNRIDGMPISTTVPASTALPSPSGNLSGTIPPSPSLKTQALGSSNAFAAAGSRDVLNSPPTGGGGLSGERAPVVVQASKDGKGGKQPVAKKRGTAALNGFGYTDLDPNSFLPLDA
ncbi:hypothetical protein SmJEL517_g02558 [Synchytrium microbalum]|uniref:Uncharacterized protein n=1 Tax=Synchytrium microbalum TaxID=1806994 RepID=A0A507C5P4_9FUNG|nr:uncharacterized protein SmJEL517_g02558 [Synchytrium microbalum]TPX34821.1 hypothetical protein SmJEL517_g02558 [Synchytrium microbalum]